MGTYSPTPPLELTLTLTRDLTLGRVIRIDTMRDTVYCTVSTTKRSESNHERTTYAYCIQPRRRNSQEHKAHIPTITTQSASLCLRRPGSHQFMRTKHCDGQGVSGQDGLEFPGVEIGVEMFRVVTVTIHGTRRLEQLTCSKNWRKCSLRQRQ